jgi:hypothetical protein
MNEKKISMFLVINVAKCLWYKACLTFDRSGQQCIAAKMSYEYMVPSTRDDPSQGVPQYTHRSVRPGPQPSKHAMHTADRNCVRPSNFTCRQTRRYPYNSHTVTPRVSHSSEITVVSNQRNCNSGWKQLGVTHDSNGSFVSRTTEMMPITVAWTVFTRSNAGIVGSNPTQGMNVCLRFFCVYVVLCVDSGLALGWSPFQVVLPPVHRLRNWKISQGPQGL